MPMMSVCLQRPNCRKKNAPNFKLPSEGAFLNGAVIINKNKKEAIMEIECYFHFKLVRKPKTKKVTLVVENEG